MLAIIDRDALIDKVDAEPVIFSQKIEGFQLIASLSASLTLNPPDIMSKA